MNTKLKEDELLTIEILEHSVSDTLSRQSNQFNSIEKTEENSTPQIMKRPPINIEIAATDDVSSDDDDDDKFGGGGGERKLESENEKQPVAISGQKRHSGTIGNAKFQFGSKGALPSPLGSAHSFDLHVNFFLII